MCAIIQRLWLWWNFRCNTIFKETLQVKSYELLSSLDMGDKQILESSGTSFLSEATIGFGATAMITL